MLLTDSKDSICSRTDTKIIDRVQNRKVNLESSQLDACILQFKELGRLRFAENRAEGEKTFRGVTLTEVGEQYLTLLSVTLRDPENRGDHAKPASPKGSQNGGAGP